ncbi:MAG: septum formation inhibitor Maf [Firmicutes bacterium]|nr:septum formation inhibitor Maf [Bacillota bacterium]
MVSNVRRLVLASNSPRRRELLQQLGLDFSVDPAEGPEEPFQGGNVAEYVLGLARSKSRQVARRHAAGTLVVGADTVVALGDQVFGKPADAAQAMAMLKRLQGTTHLVYTGVCVTEAPGGEEACAAECTAVTFRPLTEEEIARYVATGEPMDKAGAYAIQGLGSINITAVHGCYSNVVGLPLATLARLLRRWGVQIW